MQHAQSNSGPWTTFNDGLISSTGAVVTGVPTGVNLYFRVAAENSIGTGSYSSSVGPVKAFGAPAAPTGLFATVNANGTISLNWNAPNNNGDSAITDYVVEYRKSSEQNWNVYQDGPTAISNTVVTLPRVDGPYEFRVKASNSIGTGPASTVSATAEKTEDKLNNLYNAILPLLSNLKANPEKDYIYWPKRTEKVEAFEDLIAGIIK